MHSPERTAMVGRRAELDVLLTAFEDGRRGRPRSVVVRGEAGIGKTRLVSEFLAQVTTRTSPAPAGGAVAIAVGQCVDLGPIGTPFGPIRQVLRDLRAELGADAIADAAGSSAVVAALAALDPGVAEVGLSHPQPAGELAAAFEVVLENLSRTRHLVLAVEDLQWADAATLALLRTMAGSLRGRHLTIVATYRSDDVDRVHPLRPLLTELDRTRSTRHVDLRPLSTAEVAEQVAALRTGRRLDPRRMDLLTERSGGIPFLVEELVDLGNEDLPDTLRDLVLARYARLGQRAQSTIRLMSAAGLRVDHDALAAVSELDERALDLSLREAVDARIIAVDGSGYTFRHGLTREAVALELLPSERARFHRGYATFLEAHRPADSPDDVAAIAEHWLAARETPAAFDATVRALALSRASFAPATSAELAERLTELWDDVPDPARRSGTSLAALHLEAARSWHALRESQRALRAATAGLAAAPDDPMLRAALLRQRSVEVLNIENRHLRDDLAEAAALLEGVDDPDALALRSRIFTNIAAAESGPAAARSAQRAIAFAEASGDHAALAAALVVESRRRSDELGDETAALEPLERADRLLLDPAMRGYVGIAQTALLCRLGRFTDAVAAGEQRLAEASGAGIERGMGGYLRALSATAALGAGLPGRALRHARLARRTADAPVRAYAVSVLSGNLAWDDRAEDRDALLAEEDLTAPDLVAEPDAAPMLAIESAEAAVELGARFAPERATAALTTALGILDTPVAAHLRRGAAVAAALLLRSGAGTPTERERVLSEADGWPPHGATRANAALVRALLPADVPPAVQVARCRELVSVGAALAARFRRIAEFTLAEALIAAGERDEAAGILNRLAAEAPAEGLSRIARWARELAARAGLDDATGAPSSPLTPREQQVLELVAAGLTNAQIGARLFISPKTASVHVSAILAKIGAANRTEAAAIHALRAGPATPTRTRSAGESEAASGRE